MRHHRNIRAAENIASVPESVVKNPNLLIRQHSSQLGVYEGSLARILHFELHLNPHENHTF